MENNSLLNLSFTKQIHVFKTLKKTLFLKIVGGEKGENDGYQHFSFIPHCFLPYPTLIVSHMFILLSSANAFILVHFKILTHGKELNSWMKPEIKWCSKMQKIFQKQKVANWVSLCRLI